MNRDYAILEAGNAGHLCEMVRKHLAEGWTVYGNLIVTSPYKHTDGYLVPEEYLQAMLK